MILQSNVKKVIALTGATGKGYGKDCCQYFPNETKKYGKIILNGIYIVKDNDFDEVNE